MGVFKDNQELYHMEKLFLFHVIFFGVVTSSSQNNNLKKKSVKSLLISLKHETFIFNVPQLCWVFPAFVSWAGGGFYLQRAPAETSDAAQHREL